MKKKYIIKIILCILCLFILIFFGVKGGLNKIDGKDNSNEISEKKENKENNSNGNTKTVEAERIEKDRDQLLIDFDKINSKNNIEYSISSFCPEIDGGDWFYYENNNEELTEGYTLWRYRIINNFKKETTRNEIVLEYKIDSSEYEDGRLTIQELGILDYGDSMLGEMERNYEEINEALNQYVFHSDELTDYAERFKCENKSGIEQISIYQDKVKYEALTNTKPLRSEEE